MNVVACCWLVTWLNNEEKIHCVTVDAKMLRGSENFVFNTEEHSQDCSKML